MSTTFLFIALFAISVLTTLTVEGIKKLLDKNQTDYRSNFLAVGVSLVLSVAITVGYLIWTETAFNMKIALELIALMYLSFLVSTNGYDKVITELKRIKDKENL